MPPFVASIVFVIGILGLFYLDRRDGPRISHALWIPAVWLFLVSSRPTSMWLGAQVSFAGVDATEAYIEGSPIDRAVWTILLLAALAVLVSRIDRVVPLLRKNAVIVLFFAFCAVSILWSDFPFVALKRWSKAIGDLAIVCVILTDLHPLIALKRVLTRLGFIIFPLSVLYIKYYPAMGRRLTLGWTTEAIGVTTQKNELGLVCMIFGVLFLWMLLSLYRDHDDPSRKRRLLAYSAIVAMIIWLLYQCDSTTSITGLAAAACVVWLASRRSRKFAVVHALIAVLLVLCITALFFDPGGGMVEQLGKNATLTGRTTIWALVLGMHTNPLVGTGFESFWLGPRLEYMRSALPNFPINEAHNGYIEIYLNLGWVGIFFIAAMLVSAYKRLTARLQQNPQTASLFIGLLLCTIFNAFTENAFRMMNLSWISLLLVSVAASHAVLFGKASQVGSAESAEINVNKHPVYATASESPVID